MHVSVVEGGKKMARKKLISWGIWSIERRREGVLWLWGKGRGAGRGKMQWKFIYGALEGG